MDEKKAFIRDCCYTFFERIVLFVDIPVDYVDPIYNLFKNDNTQITINDGIINYFLSIYYGVKQQYEKMNHHLQLAVDMNSIEAINMMAFLKYRGFGTDKDKNMSFRYFEKTANLNNAHGQCGVAIFYHKGDCELAPQNNKLAFENFQKSAIGGFSYGMYGLFTCYRTEIGTPKNDRLALKWLCKAANLSNHLALDCFSQQYLSLSTSNNKYVTLFKYFHKLSLRDLSITSNLDQILLDFDYKYIRIIYRLIIQNSYLVSLSTHLSLFPGKNTKEALLTFAIKKLK